MASSDAFDRLVVGIQKQEPELLDELGITLRRSDAYKRLADELGVNATTLTEAQKQQALLNDIYRQSESVLGVYEAAMETSGKQQGSLTRHIEEAQASFGKLLLPFKELSIGLKTTFWKGIRDVAKGFELWVPIIRAAIDGIKGLKVGTKGVSSGFKSILGIVNPVIGSFLNLKKVIDFLGIEVSFKAAGKGAQTWGRVTVQSVALIGAAFEAAKATLAAYSEDVKALGSSLAEGFARFSTGDFAGAAVAFNEMRDQAKGIGAAFEQEFGPRAAKALSDVEAKFPDLFRDFDELGIVAETSLELIDEAAEEATAALEEQKNALAAQIPILQKLADIQENYEKTVKKIGETFADRLADLNKKAAKDEEKIRKTTLKRQDKLTEDSAKQREKIIADFNKRQVRAAQQRNKNLARENDRFRLSQLQAERRFQVRDRRLRAEGDVLALMEAREDFALQQQEEKENFDLQSKQQKESVAEQQAIQRQDLQERLAEFDNNIKERQQELLDSQKEELENLRNANIERQAELQEDYEKQLELARQNRLKQLEELGVNLKEQGEITEEGMADIVEKMKAVYGEGAEVDALMKGFTERMTEGFAGMVESMKAELAVLNEAAASTVSNLPVFSPGASAGLTTPNSITGSPLRPRPRGMREGGAGVVTGPALFAVEPGQREAVMFAPLPTAPSSNVNVNMSGGFDIHGAEPAGRAATEAALDRMVDEFTIAVSRMSRRGRN